MNCVTHALKYLYTSHCNAHFAILQCVGIAIQLNCVVQLNWTSNELPNALELQFNWTWITIQIQFICLVKTKTKLIQNSAQLNCLFQYNNITHLYKSHWNADCRNSDLLFRRNYNGRKTAATFGSCTWIHTLLFQYVWTHLCKLRCELQCPRTMPENWPKRNALQIVESPIGTLWCNPNLIMQP